MGPMETRAAALLYEDVARDISSMIDSGTLVAGERIPSLRRFSTQRRLSISTVLHAYQVLEDRGLIEARPQSGYYVRATRRTAQEPALSRPPRSPRSVDVHTLVSRVLDDRHVCDVMQFATAIPHAGLLPSRRLRRIVASIASRRPQWIASYSFPPGELALRRQIALCMRDWGVTATADELIVTNGCMEAVNLCIRAVAKPGDVIALESPTYFGLLQIIESLGMKALEIPTHPRDGISLEALELAIERERLGACVLMPTVSNPLGSSMPDAGKRRLVQMLAQRDIPLIEDAVYSALHFDLALPRAAKAYDDKGNVMLCASFSKTFSPGFRIGWVAPGRHYRRIQTLKFINTIGVSQLLQLAAAEFLANGGYGRLLRRLRRTYAGQLQCATQAVLRHFPQTTKVNRPSGGFVLWVVMPESVDSMQLYELALKHGIGICPGTMFSASQRYRDCIRMNCGMPWSERVERAIAQLGELARKLAGRS